MKSYQNLTATRGDGLGYINNNIFENTYAGKFFYLYKLKPVLPFQQVYQF